jgi:hypothetical protein
MREPENAEIINRLTVMEAMMAEGRRGTQRWGWMFLLWGIGPLVAIAWEGHWPLPSLAWPIVTGTCVIVNGALIKIRKRKGEVKTTMMRSVGAVWGSTGLTVLLIALASAFSGFAQFRASYVVLFAVVGAAHSASSMILRWLPQFFAAVVWWAATVAALVLPSGHLRALSVVALVSNVIFGAWLMYRVESER